MGFQAPFPIRGHPDRGNRLDAMPDRILRQLESAGPSRVEGATHVADLVDPVLERGNPATDECCHQIFTH